MCYNEERANGYLHRADRGRRVEYNGAEYNGIGYNGASGGTPALFSRRPAVKGHFIPLPMAL
jgi:hypothetical protein